MDDNNPASIIKMINDLRSDSNSCRPSVTSLRLSGTSTVNAVSFDDSDRDELQTPKRSRMESINSLQSIDKSTHDSVVTSPWEWQRLKGEIVSLKSRLTHQEAHIQQLHNIRRQMEEVLEKEKVILKLKNEEDNQIIRQLELRLDMGRRTIQELRDTNSLLEKEMLEEKVKLENKILILQNENFKLMDEYKNSTVQENLNSSCNSDLEKENIELKSRVEIMEEKLRELKESLKETHTSQINYELQSIELQNIKLKLEQLESEKALWEEGKQVVARAAKAKNLEKELTSAKETIATLRESVKGKLLLEEQMSNMTQKLQRTEYLEQQVAELQAKQSELTFRLNEYESINVTGGPSGLRRELNRLQQAEAVLTSEEGELRSKVETVRKECQNVTKKYEEAKRLATEMAGSSERLTKLVSRLQKKMMLVTRERDSYRQQLDMYEKEMSTSDGNNAITERIPALEMALNGYRDLVSKLETDLDTAYGTGQEEECKKLKEEVDRLKAELEHRVLKGDFNCNARIMHLVKNPTAIAAQQAEERHKALQQEVEELRTKLTGGNVETAAMSSLQAQEIAELKQSNELKITRLKEAFKAASQEYRQACYCMFGWRVDRIKEGTYKLFSQYAESPNDYLSFHVDDNGVELLETSFSAVLNSFVETYLRTQHSVPMFLNAVQQDLYSQQTITTNII